MASLPAQVRDAIVRGDFERIPPQYRAKIQEYVNWLRAEADRNAR